MYLVSEDHEAKFAGKLQTLAAQEYLPAPILFTRRSLNAI